jgi:hypothetical protein
VGYAPLPDGPNASPMFFSSLPFSSPHYTIIPDAIKATFLRNMRIGKNNITHIIVIDRFSWNQLIRKAEESVSGNSY